MERFDGRLRLSIQNEVSGIRSPETGRFIERDHSALTELNRQHALILQAKVVELIQDKTKRRATSTGRLVKVTASRDNQYANAFGFGVGDESYLDRSVAKYWRQIEEGTDVHVGAEIKGVWGGSITGFYHNAWGLVAQGGPPFSAMGQGTGEDKLIPYSGPRKFIRGKPVRTGTIENAIEAQQAYEGAWEAHHDEILQSTLAAARRIMFDVAQPRYFRDGGLA